MYGDKFGEFECGYWGLKGQLLLSLALYKGDVMES